MSVGSREFDHHPGLTPLVIDLIPDQTRAELEASIGSPLSVERWPSGVGERRQDREQERKRDGGYRHRTRNSKSMSTNYAVGCLIDSSIVPDAGGET